jgi:hypothetical protein
MRRATTAEDDPRLKWYARRAIMNDDTATTAARVRCAELILDRAHGKPVYLEDPNRDPDFVPLAERLKWYARRDAVDAAEAKIVLLPPKKQALPSALGSITGRRNWRKGPAAGGQRWLIRLAKGRAAPSGPQGRSAVYF